MRVIRELLAAIVALGKENRLLKQAIADLTTAVNANTAAINAAIAAGIGNGGASAADIASVQAITAVVAQNNAALVAATPAPGPVPVP